MTVKIPSLIGVLIILQMPSGSFAYLAVIFGVF